jgi:tetratricopeptide (TPR) repeat protein
MLGLLVLFLIAAISAFSGYQSGIDMRQNAESTQLVVHIQEQYALGIQEMEQGVYYRARQRFEYVIQLDPNYPGVTENLALVLLELNTTATPTLVPTPTITPTPDTRGIEELYDQGQQHLANSEWTESMDALLMVRKTDPEYHAVEIDGMLYLALRNRGMDKISKEADLEGGIYDLTLAEQFGPLDTEAQGFLNWASLYITGASFWEIDWGQAVYYLSQVAPHLPSLRDGSGWTALERYRFALIEFGFVLANQKEWCQAQDQLAAALSIAPDEKAQEAWAIVAERCANQNQPQQPGGDDQPKPTKTP